MSSPSRTQIITTAAKFFRQAIGESNACLTREEFKRTVYRVFHTSLSEDMTFLKAYTEHNVGVIFDQALQTLDVLPKHTYLTTVHGLQISVDSVVGARVFADLEREEGSDPDTRDMSNLYTRFSHSNELLRPTYKNKWGEVYDYFIREI